MSINGRMILAATLSLFIVTGCKNRVSTLTPITRLTQETNAQVQPNSTLEPTETLPPTETRIPLPTKTRTPEVPTRTLQLIDSKNPTPTPTLDISQGEIFFRVYPNGEIRSQNLDGRILETLVNPPSSLEINNDRLANWLPDGSKISYTADDFGQAEIWAMDNGGVLRIADLLNDGDKLPSSIVVGIEYVDTNEHGRDFHWRLEDFYAFLTNELIPLDSKYHTSLNAPRTLIGHSSGAYFTLYAFLQFEETGANPLEQFVAISGDYAKMGTFIFDEEFRLNRRIGESNTLASSLYMGVGKKDGKYQEQV